VVVFGASGDLAKKKTLPALYQLFAGGGLGAACAIFGVARSALSHEQWREQLQCHLPTEDAAKARDARDQRAPPCVNRVRSGAAAGDALPRAPLGALTSL
jgi:glucose-6-phosphate 1-dehydrogenase